MRRSFALLGLLAANAFAWLFPDGYILTAGRFNPAAIPAALGDFKGIDVQLPASVPRLLGATEVLCRRYLSPRGAGLEFLAAFYENQRAAHQPHDPELCLLGGGWKVREERVITLPLQDPRSEEPVRLKEIRAEQAGWSLEVLACHVSPRSTFPSSASAKIDRISGSLLLLRTDGVFVRLLAKRKGPPDDRSVYELASLILPYVYRAYEQR